MAPLAMCCALKSTFLDLSSRIGTNHDEKHELSALAELLAGVTASGAPFLKDPVAPSGSAWNLWFAKMVKDTLGSGSLESATGAFSVAVRYIAHHLCQLPADRSAYILFVQLLLQYEEKTGTGQSTAEMKKLSFLHNATRDVNKVCSTSYLMQHAKICSAFVCLLGLHIRHPAIGLCSALRSHPPVAKGLAGHEFSECTETDGHVHRSHLQLPLIHHFSTRTDETATCLQSTSADQNDLHSPLHPSMMWPIQDLLDVVVDRFYDGLQCIQSMKSHTETPTQTTGDSASGSMDAEKNGKTSEDLDLGALQSKIGLAVQFVVAAMHDAQVRQLTPTLVRLLPGIFQIQVRHRQDTPGIHRLNIWGDL